MIETSKTEDRVKEHDSSLPFDERILWAYFEAKTTPEEERQLLVWLEADEEHRREFAELHAVWQRLVKGRASAADPLRFARSLNRLNERLDALAADAAYPARKSAGTFFGRQLARLRPMLRVAAVVMFVVLSGTIAWQVITAPESIVHFNGDTTVMHVAMPDGTDIWLTPGTTLSYTEDFRTDNRQVQLEGEAYFDVVHDDSHPFDVVTPNLRVRVLGTVFSVRSWRDDPRAEATLAEGSVALQRPDGSNLIRLHPGQRALYDATCEQLEINQVPIGDHLALHYGIITLDNATLAQIKECIETTYGVRLEIAPGEKLSDDRYNFSFQKDSPVEDVVELLQFVSGIRFEIGGGGGSD